jgi:hypothetical protein
MIRGAEVALNRMRNRMASRVPHCVCVRLILARWRNENLRAEVATEQDLDAASLAGLDPN